jgi:hypothetical protein
MTRSFTAAVFAASSFLALTSQTVFASPDGNSPLTKAFANCMVSKAKTGSYTSSDSGKSAMRLMVDCDAQWTPWQNQCMADGETDGDCAIQAAALAQSALMMMGK